MAMENEITAQLAIRNEWLGQVQEDILESDRRIVDPHHRFFVERQIFRITIFKTCGLIQGRMTLNKQSICNAGKATENLDPKSCGSWERP